MINVSGLAAGGEGRADFAGIGRRGDGGAGLDFAESGLVFADVVGEGSEEVLGVLGSHDDAALDTCLLHIGHHGYEIDKHLVGGVGDYGEVGIVA